jgi:hypothetical protein
MGRNPTEHLIDRLAADLQPTRAMRFGAGIVRVALATAATLLLVLLWPGMRPDVRSGALTPMFLISQGLFLLLGLAAATTVILMGNPQVGNRHDGWKWALAMTSLLPLAAIIIALVNGRSSSPLFMPTHDIFCLAHGTGFGLLVGAALLLWLRRGAPASPPRAGLLTGIAAGSIGIFAYSFSCPLDSIYHVGIWHSMAVIVSALLGRAIVPGLIRW